MKLRGESPENDIGHDSGECGCGGREAIQVHYRNVVSFMCFQG